MTSADVPTPVIAADSEGILGGTTLGHARTSSAAADAGRAARGSRDGSSKEHKHKHKKHRHKDRKHDSTDPTDHVNMSAPADRGSTRHRDEVGGGRGSDVESGEIQDGGAGVKCSAADDVTSRPVMPGHGQNGTKEAQPSHMLNIDPTEHLKSITTSSSSKHPVASSLLNQHTHHASTTHRAAAAEGGSGGAAVQGNDKEAYPRG